MKMINFVLAILFGLAIPVWAQQQGIVEGRILNATLHTPIPGANIVLKGTHRGAASDKNGFFRIAAIAPGQYILEISAIGYARVEKEINVQPGKRVQLTIPLKPHILQAPPVTVTESGFRPAESYEIKVMQPSDVRPAVSAELVAEMPGVSLQRVGSWGSKPVVRGFHDEQVVVFVNGVRINRAGPAKMDAALATVPAEEIQKIEILRGPEAAIYGPGAIGGMINVLTAPSASFLSHGLKISGFVRGSAASAANKAASTAGLTLTGKQLQLSGNGGLITQQDYHSPRGEMPNTAFREHFGNFNFRFKLTPQQQLRLNAQIYRLSDAGFPGQAAEIPDDDRDAFTLQYMVRPPSSRINRLQFSASYLRMFHHMLVHAVDNPMMRVDADVKATSKTYAAKFRSSLLLSRKWSSLVGGDFYRWNGDAARQRIILQKMQGTQKRTGDETLWPGVNIDDLGIFSQNTFLLHKRFNLEAGLRFDRISADGNLPVNSKITAAPNFSKNFVGGNLIGTYHISPSVSARLGLGRAFRAPDPSELYISLPLPVGTGNPPLAFFLGNPKLNLEKSWQIEAGLGGKKARWQWNINLFYHRVEDLILAVITGDSLSNLPVRQYRNLPLAILAGGEASLHWQPVDKLALQSVLSYTWGETRSSVAGIPNRAPLPEIPPFDLTSSIRYNILPAWYVQMRWRVVAAQNRAAEYTRELATGGFQTMDVKTWYQWQSNLTLVAGIRNLFNKTYAEHLSQLGRTRSVAIQQHLDRILEPGRDVYLSLEWHF